MAAELIIQLQDATGYFGCEKYINMPSPKSVYIAICFTDSPQSEALARDLKDNLIRDISRLTNNFAQRVPPCGGGIGSLNNCMALRNPDNIKLLIVVTDGTIHTFANPDVLHWSHTILPVVQAGNNVNLPAPLNIPNAVFWQNSITEVIPTIFGIAEISDDDQKIFISYRRQDTSVFAEQLFDRLTHEHFEVFLDKFSINPSINFQNRLYQELADKAMVLLIESPTYQQSQWVQYEIDFAKKYRLGLYAINVDNSPKVNSVDNEYRSSITLQSGELDPIALNNLVIEIKRQHASALYRMKNYLNDNVMASLQSSGKIPTIDGRGFISYSNGQDTLRILTTPRPPKVDDYHYTNISNMQEKKVIFGPRFMEEKRETLNTWLAEKSEVDFYNEGQILELIAII